MRNLVSFLFILISAVFGFAQISPDSKTEEVSVVSAGFTAGDSRNFQITFSDVPYVQRSNNSSLAAPAPPDVPKYSKQLETIKLGMAQSHAQVSIKNNTQKKINSIEYDFIVQDSDGKELKRYALVNESDIKGNKTTTISNVILFQTNRSVSYRAEIKRVKYKDGSVWTP